MRLRDHVRSATGWLAGAVLAILVLGPGGNFVTALYESWGWTKNPDAKVSAFMSAFMAIVAEAWFPWLAGGILGFAAGVWLDTLLRRNSGAATSEDRPFLRASRASQAMAALAGLGWSVKTGPDVLTFDATGSIPPMIESAIFFAEIDKPFRIQLQSIPHIDGLQVLAGLINCQYLHVGASESADISELRGFVHLQGLGLNQIPMTSTSIVDGTVIGTMKSLRELTLGNTRLRDLSFLSSLTQLEKLGLGDTLVWDLTPISFCRSLKWLSVHTSRTLSLNALSGNRNLRELHVSGNYVPEFTVLSHLEVEIMNIFGYQQADLTPVGSMITLEELAIITSGSIDVSALMRLTNLRRLHISSIPFNMLAQFTGHEAFSHLTNLRVLTLSQLALNDLASISGAKNLREISLSAVPITSIEPLRACASLQKLSLAQTNIVDVSPLLDMPALSELTVKHTPARADVLAELERRGVLVNRY